MPKSPNVDDYMPDEPAVDPLQAGMASGAAPADPDSLVERMGPQAMPPPPEGIGVPGRGSKWTRLEATRYLASCPKVPINVPLSDSERSNPGHYVQLVVWNGWAITVPKGESVRVPAPIAEILEQAGQAKRTLQAQTARAIDLMLVTPDRPGGMLVPEYSDQYALELIQRGAPMRWEG